jgi:phosphoribosylpyrophosphate synthetase
MGVDRIIAVDLERPGSSNESNFFSPSVPVETLLTTNLFAEHIARTAFPVAHGGDVLVVSPSSALMKKSVGFATVLARCLPNADVRVTTFVHSSARAGPVDVSTNELIASGDVKGRDVILVDELIGECCALSDV